MEGTDFRLIKRCLESRRGGEKKKSKKEKRRKKKGERGGLLCRENTTLPRALLCEYASIVREVAPARRPACDSARAAARSDSKPGEQPARSDAYALSSAALSVDPRYALNVAGAI